MAADKDQKTPSLPDMTDGNTKLLAYFMDQTNQRLSNIEVAIKDLLAFKATMIQEAKQASMGISAITAVIVGVLVQLVVRLLINGGSLK